MNSFEQVITDVYENFFKSMVENPLYTKFFTGRNISKVKKQQMEGVLNLYFLFKTKKERELKEELLKLGRLHENLGIEFALFSETVNRFELLVIKELFKKKVEEIEKIYLESITFFEFIKHYTALGYLKEYVKKEKKIIREFIEKNIQRRAPKVKEIINKHLVWEEKILDFIAGESEKLEVETDFHKCEIGKWLRDIDTYDVNKNVLHKLEKLHMELHHIADSIISFKKDEKYEIVVNEYHYFVKTNLLFLSSLITFVFSERLKELQKDPLTGALSRSVLEEIYSKVMELSIISEQSFGIAFIDIDNFKKVNDTYGHPVGDIVLKKITQTMKKNIRKSDYLFRYGGEEFVILAPATEKEDFFRLLEKIRKDIQNLKVKGISVTVSIGGVVIKSKRFIPIEHLIEKADRLMYKAKRAGKNRVIVEEI